MEIIGTIIVKGNTQSYGANGFQRRELVITFADNPEYPQYRKLDLIKDKCQLIDNINIGDKVKLKFDLNGRKWVNPKGEEVYFNTDQVWYVEKIDQASDIGEGREENEQIAGYEKPDGSYTGDDLPFAISLTLLLTFLLQYTIF